MILHLTFTFSVSANEIIVAFWLFVTSIGEEVSVTDGGIDT